MQKTIFCVILAVLAAYATPNLISYQGKVEKDGSPFSGEATMEFALYEFESGGTPFWSETQNVTVVDGIFNVLLGSVETLPALPLDECWLEVKVDGDVLPRQQITSVPYSQIADQAYSHFKMVEDTAMDYTCPADGVLLIGGGSRMGYWTFWVDGNVIISGTEGGCIQPISITAGIHHISARTTSPDIGDVRLWAIFMR